MVYAGKINKKIVSLLQSISCNALGISGADGNAYSAIKRPIKDIDFGFVGDLNEINIFLNFIKSFGVASLQIAHAPYKEHNIIKYSTYLSKNKVKKLFGKI